MCLGPHLRPRDRLDDDADYDSSGDDDNHDRSSDVAHTGALDSDDSFSRAFCEIDVLHDDLDYGAGGCGDIHACHCGRQEPVALNQIFP